MYLKQTTFQMTNGGAGPARTQLHVSALSNRAAGAEQSPDGDELNKPGRPPQSDAHGETRDAIAQQDWWIHFPLRVLISPTCVRSLPSSLNVTVMYRAISFDMFFWLLLMLFTLHLRAVDSCGFAQLSNAHRSGQDQCVFALKPTSAWNQFSVDPENPQVKFCRIMSVCLS